MIQGHGGPRKGRGGGVVVPSLPARPLTPATGNRRMLFKMLSWEDTEKEGGGGCLSVSESFPRRCRGILIGQTPWCMSDICVFYRKCSLL